MAKMDAVITIEMRDLASVQLMHTMLRLLHDEMRVEANTRADALGAILDRFERRMLSASSDGTIDKDVTLYCEWCGAIRRFCVNGQLVPESPDVAEAARGLAERY